MQLVQVPPPVAQALQAGAAVCLSTSGGKDSIAMALAVCAYLDTIGHVGPRVLVHADLGRIEWQDSLPTCRRLAEKLGLELVVVRRKSGDMVARWEQRWRDNVARWEALDVARLILPWSTPAWRFCTSELKSAPIAQEMVRRYPRCTIINASGIRAQESANRAKAPICKANPRLDRKGAQTTGLDWNPIHHWTTDQVFHYLADQRFELHEAYRLFGSERVSCAFCIMSSLNDLRAGISCSHNEAAWHLLLDLEHRSSFQFQGGRWLAELAPAKLTQAQAEGLVEAKQKHATRLQLEQTLPPAADLTNGKASRALTPAEADTIATYRRELGQLLGLCPRYTTAAEVLAAYEARL